MRVSLGIFILGIGVATWAQQGGDTKSSTTSQSGQSNPATSAPSQPPQNAGKTQTQPASPVRDDLRFPEDDPSQPDSPTPSQPSATQSTNSAPSKSDQVPVQDLGPAAGDSSSKDTPVDLNPPSDDAKAHPQSSEAVANAEADSLKGGSVTELHAWDPHKAAKDIEVGDFYFKRGSYRAAEARYRDALLYKDNNAIAMFRLAECLEKLGIFDEARIEYEGYLKILPHGPEAEKAEKGIARLKAETESK